MRHSRTMPQRKEKMNVNETGKLMNRIGNEKTTDTMSGKTL